MAEIRWLRISAALARLGYAVDMIVDVDGGLVERAPGLRLVPWARAEWDSYDVIKTLFHKGFESLRDAGMEGHPFVISKLGSVVGGSDDVAGVHFFGDERARLYATQTGIARASRYVTLLTEASTRLWVDEHGGAERCLLVPTGVDAVVPPPATNPYAAYDEPIALYLGNIYAGAQREVNLLWQAKLNDLGRRLRRRGIRLCFVGVGAVDRLEPEAVTCLGAVENDRVWDYQHFAHVGVALAQGRVQHNESSKIYYYLRTGLPVVAEAPIPNCDVIRESGLGAIVDYQDSAAMVDAIADAAHREWDRAGAIRYVLARHTWDERAATYDRVIRAGLGLEGDGA
jgi:glycosyltransferase involved in cell wall biosynthesis